MKRVGIIGTGMHGSRYAEHLKNDIADLSLQGISRRSEAGTEQAERWRTEFFADWQDLVRHPEIDALIVVTPPHLNLQVAKLCAENGKPLLVEKPLGCNGDEAKKIVEVMASAGCPLTVGQTLRYNPVIQALAKLLPEQQKLHSFSVNQRLEPSSLGWHDIPEKAGAGVIIHTAVHIFDALRIITGKRIARVIATEKCVHSKRLADLVTVLVELEDGTLGTVDVSKVGMARSGRYEFVSQGGQLHGDQVHAFTYRIAGREVSEKKQYEQLPTIQRLLADWSSFLHGKGVNPVTGEDGLYAVQVCDACVVSAKTQRWVEV